MTKKLKTYNFAVPGAVGYETIQAENQEQAEAIADSMCATHRFLA